MCTFVIADTSKTFRQGLKRMLSEQGEFECVFTSGRGREVLAACIEYTPDFIVIDEDLRDMPSLELVAQLSAQIPTLLIIGTSLFNEQSARLQFLAAGALFIPKNLLMSTLPDELVNLVNTHRGDSKP